MNINLEQVSVKYNPKDKEFNISVSDTEMSKLIKESNLDWFDTLLNVSNYLKAYSKIFEKGGIKYYVIISGNQAIISTSEMI